MTRSRAAVLAVLDAASEPLSVSSVKDTLDCPCDQATVYRALHWLEEEGMAESFVLSCQEHGTERYYVSAASPHRHWFHCSSCHRFTDLGACCMGNLVEDLERKRGIRIERHILYFTGTCEACRA